MSKPSQWILFAQNVNTAAYIATIVIGIAGNVWVAWKAGLVYLFDRKSTVPRNILMLILLICIADLLVLIDLILYVHFQLKQQWIFGSTVCKSFYCLEVVNKLLIPLALVEISRASYESVRNFAFPEKPETSDQKRNCIYLAAIMIIVTTLMMIVGYFADTQTYTIIRNGTEKRITVCSFNPLPPYALAFNITAFVVGYVFTSAAYVYFYLNVPILLKRRYSRIKADTRTRLDWFSILRIRRTVTAFVIVYLTCWTPYWILFWFLSFWGVTSSWMVVISTFTHLLPYMSCTAYPVILTAINKGIKKAHSTIVDSQRKKLLTIRQGAYQAISAHIGMVQTWLLTVDRPSVGAVALRQRFRMSSSVSKKDSLVSMDGSSDRNPVSV